MGDATATDSGVNPPGRRAPAADGVRAVDDPNSRSTDVRPELPNPTQTASDADARSESESDGDRLLRDPKSLSTAGTTPGPAVAPVLGEGQREAHSELVDACVNSATWAAWADAVGFISELTSPNGLLRRIEGRRPLPGDTTFDQVRRLFELPPDQWPLQGTRAWTRRVGGRGGVEVKLPSGTYSDDTQMRLATSRSIGVAGFSVETFAAIELPAFTSYGLGGGNATKGGAAAMARTSASWAAPGHEGWANAGGNGVVMRVAPHAYVAAALDDGRFDLVLDVLRNGVVTHGHPRALLPAVLHAVALTETLKRRAIAPMRVLHDWLDQLTEVPDWMLADAVFASDTLPAFERETGMPFAQAWVRTVHEMHDLVARFDSVPIAEDAPSAYLRLTEETGLRSKKTLGVGTATLVAALWLADRFRHAPHLGVLVAANAVGTDTDTIATIAGAHLGVAHPFMGHEHVLDRDYLQAETVRLVAPSDARAAAPMRYPILDSWRSPRAQADFVGLEPSSGRVAVAGLGAGEFIAAAVSHGAGSDFAWQWFAADFGQTLLIKRRTHLEPLPAFALAPVVTQGGPGRPTVGDSAELDELRARLNRANSTASAAGRKRGDGPGARRAEAPSSSEPEPAAGDRSQGSARPLGASVGQGEVAASGEPESSSLSVSAAGDTLAGLSFAGAVERARRAGYEPDVVGRLAYALTRNHAPEVAIAFMGHVIAYWSRPAP